MSLNAPLRDWHGRCVWLVGASSGIGAATASLLHARGASVVVSARSVERLAAFTAAHPGSEALPLDVSEDNALKDAARTIVEGHGRLDLVVYCAGHYKAMRASAFDLAEMLRHDQINYGGALRFLDAVLPVLLAQARAPGAAGRGGHVSLIGSVAGYRGLPNGLAYGPTKAALNHLAEALYLDLAPLGVDVSLVCPGFVETPLTAGNAFQMPALITPEQAAIAILDGWARGRFEIHFPKRFTRVMKVLRLLGDGLYFKAVRRVTGL